MKKVDIISYLPQNNLRFQQEESDSKGTLIFSGINNYALEFNNIISGVDSNQSVVSLDFQNKDIVIKNDKHILRMEKDRIGSSITLLQTAQEKSFKMRFGTIETYDEGFYIDDFNLYYKSGNLDLDVRPRVNGTGVLLSGEAGLLPNTLVYLTGDQTVSGIKTFATGVVVSGNLQVSGTGAFNALDLNNIDNLSLSGLDITINSSSNLSITNSNIAFSGNNINFENENNINLAYQFPAWTGIRRYPPLDFSNASSTNGNVASGAINYFPFLIKKKVTNPVACIEMVSYIAPDPKVVIGIYSGNYGLENAKLITSGSITANISNTGICRVILNGTFDEGPYIVASMLESGQGSFFRIISSSSFREHFGINTGSSIIHGLNSTLATNVLAETGASTLSQNISSGATWFANLAGNLSPLVFLEY